MSKKSLFVVGWSLALLSLIALPIIASDPGVIGAGSDLWRTPGDGTTSISFELDPIPAGFFCAGSPAFTDRLAFGGSPLETDPPGVLGSTDTIVERLDDAVFDARGVAYTRIQVRALSFEGLAPLKTSCGAFAASVRLEGEQPITHMRIERLNEGGGRFLAPIAVDIKMVFTRIDGDSGDAPGFDPEKGRSFYRAGKRPSFSAPLELSYSLRFAPSPDAFWSDRFGPTGLESPRSVAVDVDGDGRFDSFVAGTSNFAAGWAAVAFTRHSIRLAASTEARWADRPGESDRGHPEAIIVGAESTNDGINRF